MNKLFFLFPLLITLNLGSCSPVKSKTLSQTPEKIKDVSVKPIPGAEQMPLYLPLLKHKRVALVVNHTSVVYHTHLADTLLASGINVTKIFAPEHGFRGTEAAGATVKNAVDVKTGLSVVSLYGKNKKPLPAQLSDVDILVFDIQDVGARFYTYISTMYYVMEAAAENGKEVLILDRPNPNGNYVDGPVLDLKNKSFVGLLPIPIIHGCTVGELAKMINGEKWLSGGKTCKLTVIKAKGYTHNTPYSLPISPSPNLPNDLSIKLYPSLCLFEGTEISVGRGTDFPFQVIGFPDPAYGNFTFTPVSIPGVATYPPLENKLCYGIDFRNKKVSDKFTLKYLINYYTIAKDKEQFFNAFFVKLAGVKTLKEQIIKGMTEEQIRKTWEPALSQYKAMRKKYLLYPDFK